MHPMLARSPRDRKNRLSRSALPVPRRAHGRRRSDPSEDRFVVCDHGEPGGDLHEALERTDWRNAAGMTRKPTAGRWAVSGVSPLSPCPPTWSPASGEALADAATRRSSKTFGPAPSTSSFGTSTGSPPGHPPDRPAARCARGLRRNAALRPRPEDTSSAMAPDDRVLRCTRPC